MFVESLADVLDSSVKNQSWSRKVVQCKNVYGYHTKIYDFVTLSPVTVTG